MVIGRKPLIFGLLFLAGSFLRIRGETAPVSSDASELQRQELRSLVETLERQITESAHEIRRKRVFVTLRERSQAQALASVQGELMSFRGQLENPRVSRASIRSTFERVEQALNAAEREFAVSPAGLHGARLTWQEFTAGWDQLPVATTVQRSRPSFRSPPKKVPVKAKSMKKKQKSGATQV